MVSRIGDSGAIAPQAIGEQFPALTRAGPSAQAEVRLHQRNYQEKQVSTVSEVQESESQIRSLSIDQLEALGEALLDFTQPEELITWLERNA